MQPVTEIITVLMTFVVLTVTMKLSNALNNGNSVLTRDSDMKNSLKQADHTKIRGTNSKQSKHLFSNPAFMTSSSNIPNRDLQTCQLCYSSRNWFTESDCNGDYEKDESYRNWGTYRRAGDSLDECEDDVCCTIYDDENRKCCKPKCETCMLTLRQSCPTGYEETTSNWEKYWDEDTSSCERSCCSSSLLTCCDEIPQPVPVPVPVTVPVTVTVPVPVAVPVPGIIPMAMQPSAGPATAPALVIVPLSPAISTNKSTSPAVVAASILVPIVVILMIAVVRVMIRKQSLEKKTTANDKDNDIDINNSFYDTTTATSTGVEQKTDKTRSIILIALQIPDQENEQH